jgi:hypothetical protein
MIFLIFKSLLLRLLNWLTYLLVKWFSCLIHLGQNLSCPKLIVLRHVKTEPAKCLTSPSKIGARCQLLCSKGYQRKGPALATCKAAGKWDTSPNATICTGKDSKREQYDLINQ